MSPTTKIPSNVPEFILNACGPDETGPGLVDVLAQTSWLKGAPHLHIPVPLRTDKPELYPKSRFRLFVSNMPVWSENGMLVNIEPEEILHCFTKEIDWDEIPEDRKNDEKLLRMYQTPTLDYRAYLKIFATRDELVECKEIRKRFGHGITLASVRRALENDDFRCYDINPYGDEEDASLPKKQRPSRRPYDIKSWVFQEVRHLLISPVPASFEMSDGWFGEIIWDMTKSGKLRRKEATLLLGMLPTDEYEGVLFAVDVRIMEHIRDTDVTYKASGAHFNGFVEIHPTPPEKAVEIQNDENWPRRLTQSKAANSSPGPEGPPEEPPPTSGPQSKRPSLSSTNGVHAGSEAGGKATNTVGVSPLPPAVERTLQAIEKQSAAIHGSSDEPREETSGSAGESSTTPAEGTPGSAPPQEPPS
jgi:hypothetical protein